MTKVIGGSTDRPYVIHPFYTGRDKGAIRAHDKSTGITGDVLLFFSPGDAWWYIFNTLQPNDERAKHNYVVKLLSSYQAER